ncbi:uncharacterized protein FIBRA_00959 [Fibroporia radiculosa]|uniref:Uncharacterized protein n=1 Tax=Fibroporia radiculosa TaxID=599839 RepID=J4I881_9APHY|nr:uncharacterized protein FIBRA_00959 [Fibroporia radiculosa]CCL98951.1 predicted protein [Fibroporia radiculosa]
MVSLSPQVVSPALSTSSYDYISAKSTSDAMSPSYRALSDAASSDGDEIVWSVSDLSLSRTSISGVLSQGERRSRSPTTVSEEDFIVLSRTMSPARLNAVTTSSRKLHSDAMQALEREITAAISALTLAQPSPQTAPPSRPTRFDIRRAVGISSETTSSVRLPSPKKGKKKGKEIAVGGVNASRAKGEKKEKKVKALASPSPAASSAASSPKTKAVGGTPAPSSPSKKGASPPATSPPVSPSKKSKAKRVTGPTSTNLLVPTTSSGLGERAIVDDVSEAGDNTASDALYHDAVEYISTFLSQPGIKSGSNLKLLQALIIELGLSSLPSLPHSLRAAKAFLKSHVFLNVRDYLAVRGQGLDALRRVMHPNRSSLMREIRSGKRVPVKHVKDSGLNVLLITCH